MSGVGRRFFRFVLTTASLAACGGETGLDGNDAPVTAAPQENDAAGPLGGAPNAADAGANADDDGSAPPQPTNDCTTGDGPCPSDRCGWGPTVLVASGVGTDGGTWHIAGDARGDVVTAYVDGNALAPDLLLAHIGAGADAWTSRIVSFRDYEIQDLVMRADGRAALAYRTWVGGAYELRWADWDPAVESPAGVRLGTGFAASLAVLGDGLIATWQDGVPDAFQPEGALVAAELAPGAAAFGAPVPIGDGQALEAALSANGDTAAYAWYSSTNGLDPKFYIARRDASGWSTPTNVSVGRPIWGSVLVDLDGDVHAIWQETTVSASNRLTLASRRYDAGDGFWMEPASPWSDTTQSPALHAIAGAPNGHAVVVTEFAPGEITCNLNDGVCEAHVLHYDPATDTWTDIGELETFGGTIGPVRAVIHESGNAAVSWSAHDGGSSGWTTFVNYYDAASDTWAEPVSIVMGAQGSQLHMDASGNVWFLWIAESQMSARRWTCASP